MSKTTSFTTEEKRFWTLAKPLVLKRGTFSFIKDALKSCPARKRPFFDRFDEGSFVFHSSFSSKEKTVEEDLNDIEQRVRRIDKTMVFIVAYAAIALMIMGVLA